MTAARSLLLWAGTGTQAGALAWMEGACAAGDRLMELLPGDSHFALRPKRTTCRARRCGRGREAAPARDADGLDIGGAARADGLAAGRQTVEMGRRRSRRRSERLRDQRVRPTVRLGGHPREHDRTDALRRLTDLDAQLAQARVGRLTIAGDLRDDQARVAACVDPVQSQAARVREARQHREAGPRRVRRWPRPPAACLGEGTSLRVAAGTSATALTSAALRSCHG